MSEKCIDWKYCVKLALEPLPIDGETAEVALMSYNGSPHPSTSWMSLSRLPRGEGDSDTRVLVRGASTLGGEGSGGQQSVLCAGDCI